MKSLGRLCSVFLCLGLLHCGNSESKIAGTMIETNTGNGEFARVFVSTSAMNLSVNDTVLVSQMEADTVGDTVYVFRRKFEKVADSLSVAAGILELDSVPVGRYDSVEVHSATGVVAAFLVDWDVSENDILFDSALKISSFGMAELPIPEEFRDLVSSGETFAQMPFPIRLKKDVPNPCLFDADRNLILLERTDSLPDSSVYWGVMPQVLFAEDGASILFEVLGNCQESNAIEIPLARRTEHFSPTLTLDSLLTNYLISPFEPFVENSHIGVAFWILADSALQTVSYGRILGAKADSAGFVIQQRADRGSVNLRLDSRGGDYNALYGTARVLDGSWHHYAFTLYADSVTVFADGVVVDRGAFDSGEGFENVANPLCGGEDHFNGNLDEIFFLDGSESEGWMRLFYALQKGFPEVGNP